MRRGRNDSFFTMRMAKLSRLAGGRAPKGAEGDAHGNNTGCIHGQHKRVEKRGEVTLVHGKPLRPCGPPPLQGGGVLPSNGQTLCSITNPSQRNSRFCSSVGKDCDYDMAKLLIEKMERVASSSSYYDKFVFTPTTRIEIFANHNNILYFRNE